MIQFKKVFYVTRSIKSMIKYAIGLDIDYIKRFLRYEGDKVMKTITKRKEVVDLIEPYAKNLYLDYKYAYEISGKHGLIYNIFIGGRRPFCF